MSKWIKVKGQYINNNDSQCDIQYFGLTKDLEVWGVGICFKNKNNLQINFDSKEEAEKEVEKLMKSINGAVK